MPSFVFYITIVALFSITFETLALNEEENFDNFIREFGRSYVKGSKEYIKRLKIFKQSLKRHNYYNSKRIDNHSAYFGVNQFSDLLPEEFRVAYLKTSKNVNAHSNAFFQLFAQSENRSKSFDWRDKGVITKVNNQGACGACWAFSVVETVESMRAIKYKNLTELSVQQVIDCSPGGQKCSGGDTCLTAKWLVDNAINLVDENDYPLRPASQSCKNISGKSGTVLKSVSCLKVEKDENQLLTLIETHGPVTAAVDATLWQDYMGGIIQHHCYDTVNHAVQVVGFNGEGPVPYYIVRNSWGESFGNNGYVYIKIGGNVCGIGQQIVTLEVK